MFPLSIGERTHRRLAWLTFRRVRQTIDQNSFFSVLPVSRNFWVGRVWWFYEFLKATQVLSDYNFKIRIIVMVVDGRNAKVISNLQQQHYGIWFFWLATKHFLHHTHNALILYFMTFSKHQMLGRGVQVISKYVVNLKRKEPFLQFLN